MCLSGILSPPRTDPIDFQSSQRLRAIFTKSGHSKWFPGPSARAVPVQAGSEGDTLQTNVGKIDVFSSENCGKRGNLTI